MTDFEIELAIDEFDSSMRSNINFMNAESVKCLLFDSGT
jgi:hypothetical protein